MNSVKILDSSSKHQSSKWLSAGIIPNVYPRREPMFSGYDPLILIVSAKKLHFLAWNESPLWVRIVRGFSTEGLIHDRNRSEFSFRWMVGAFNPRMKSSLVWTDGSTVRAVRSMHKSYNIHFAVAIEAFFKPLDALMDSVPNEKLAEAIHLLPAPTSFGKELF
jgi:hypothetical protein